MASPRSGSRSVIIYKWSWLFSISSCNSAPLGTTEHARSCCSLRDNNNYYTTAISDPQTILKTLVSTVVILVHGIRSGLASSRVLGITEGTVSPRGWGDTEEMASPRSGSRSGNGPGSEQVAPSTPAIQLSLAVVGPPAPSELQSRL